MLKLLLRLVGIGYGIKTLLQIKNINIKTNHKMIMKRVSKKEGECEIGKKNISH